MNHYEYRYFPSVPGPSDASFALRALHLFAQRRPVGAGEGGRLAPGAAAAAALRGMARDGHGDHV